nr:Chain C, ALA-CYS-SER-SER-ILE-TRP-CYS-PRO-ASP-GLY [synthetic construct]7TB1_D Chain D, ALA-CYS-SER-SER-ILE-TRP-CYS-PRO-ASP-GLY [synthetic construct]
ACSSIWCPDG